MVRVVEGSFKTSTIDVNSSPKSSNSLMPDYDYKK